MQDAGMGVQGEPDDASVDTGVADVMVEHEPSEGEEHGEPGMEADGDMGSEAEAAQPDDAQEGPDDSMGVAYSGHGSESGDGMAIAGEMATFVGVGT
jgi:hypothetical protein